MFQEIAKKQPGSGYIPDRAVFLCRRPRVPAQVVLLRRFSSAAELRRK